VCRFVFNPTIPKFYLFIYYLPSTIRLNTLYM
jgi:hypothetical protein